MPLADFGYQPGDRLGSISGILAMGSRHNIAMLAAIAAPLPTAHINMAPWERHSP
jgi:hypothetical protein